MSAPNLTSGAHNDFVGGEASRGRIPGAEKATTGHHFVAVDLPREHYRHADALRAEEHLPASTGRDAPPAGDVAPGTRTGSSRALPSEILNQREAAPRERSSPRAIRTQGSPLAPAPDSRTVIDEDPYDAPLTAGDTLTGATSQDVHGGIGKPGSGMSSAEMHHDGMPHRKRREQGTDQYGTGEIPRKM